MLKCLKNSGSLNVPSIISHDLKNLNKCDASVSPIERATFQHLLPWHIKPAMDSLRRRPRLHWLLFSSADESTTNFGHHIMRLLGSHLVCNKTSSVHKKSCSLVQPSQYSHWLEWPKHHHTCTIDYLSVNRSHSDQHQVYLCVWRQQTTQTLMTSHLKHLVHLHQMGKSYYQIDFSRWKKKDKVSCPMKKEIANNDQFSLTFSLWKNAQIFWCGSKKPKEASL